MSRLTSFKARPRRATSCRGSRCHRRLDRDLVTLQLPKDHRMTLLRDTSLCPKIPSCSVSYSTFTSKSQLDVGFDTLFEVNFEPERKISYENGTTLASKQPLISIRTILHADSEAVHCFVYFLNRSPNLQPAVFVKKRAKIQFSKNSPEGLIM